MGGGGDTVCSCPGGMNPSDASASKTVCLQSSMQVETSALRSLGDAGQSAPCPKPCAGLQALQEVSRLGEGRKLRSKGEAGGEEVQQPNS